MARKKYRSPQEVAQEALIEGMANAIFEVIKESDILCGHVVWPNDEYDQEITNACRKAAKAAQKYWREGPWLQATRQK